jgi:hypothetical protein
MKLIITSILAALAIGGLTGCAAPEPTRSLLISAGFRALPPSTDKQKAIYSSMPAYRLEQERNDAGVIIPSYRYKDEKAGVVYVGNEAHYQHYVALARADYAFRTQRVVQALHEQQVNQQIVSLRMQQNMMQMAMPSPITVPHYQVMPSHRPPDMPLVMGYSPIGSNPPIWR